MKEVILSSSNKDDFLTKLEGYSGSIIDDHNLAIIIDGPTLIYALEND